LSGQCITEEIREKIKIFLKSNETENITCQNLGDRAKAVLRGKFIAIRSYIKKNKTDCKYIV
jgi:predicted Fe-Mo cluster-binding NifX family protein